MRYFSLLIFMVFSPALFADTQNTFAYGNPTSLFKMCQNYVNERGTIATNFACTSYIAGVIDSLQNELSLAKTLDLQCYNESNPGVSLDQIARIYVKFMNNNPQTLNVSPASVITTLYISSFPIPKKCILQSKKQGFIDKVINKFKK